MWASCQVKCNVQSSEIQPWPSCEVRTLLFCSVQSSYRGLWTQGWPRTMLMLSCQDHIILFCPDNAYSHHGPFRRTLKSAAKEQAGGRQNALLLDPHLLPCNSTAWGALSETSAVPMSLKREVGAWPKLGRLEDGLLGDQNSSGRDIIEVYVVFGGRHGWVEWPHRGTDNLKRNKDTSPFSSFVSSVPSSELR